MADELSQKDLDGLKDVFGKTMLESMTAMVDSKKGENDASKVLAEARFNTIVAKLDTIITKLEAKK